MGRFIVRPWRRSRVNCVHSSLANIFNKCYIKIVFMKNNWIWAYIKYELGDLFSQMSQTICFSSLLKNILFSTALNYYSIFHNLYHTQLNISRYQRVHFFYEEWMQHLYLRFHSIPPHKSNGLLLTVVYIEYIDLD